MRGIEVRPGSLFSYVDLAARVPPLHPLRTIRGLVDAALARLDGDFAALYAPIGRPSIPPEQLLRALLLQAFYTVCSERQLLRRGLASVASLGSPAAIRDSRGIRPSRGWQAGASPPGAAGADQKLTAMGQFSARSICGSRRGFALSAAGHSSALYYDCVDCVG